jgi:hypothetical protein
LPGITFDGTTKFLRVGAGSTGTLTQPNSFSLAGKVTSQVGVTQSFLISQALEQWIGLQGSTDKWFGYAGVVGVPASVTTDNVYHAMQAVFNSTSSHIYIDGTDATVDVGTVNTSNMDFVMGMYGDTTSNPLNGVVLEAGVWDVSTLSNFAALNSQQHSYWGF